MSETNLEDNFFDIEESQQSLDNINDIYRDQFTDNYRVNDIDDNKSKIPRNENDYIDLLKEINKTRNIAPKNIKDIQPLFESDINYDENSDVDIISSIYSNSSSYSLDRIDEDSDFNKNSQAYYENEARYLDNRNMNYIYYTTAEDNDIENSMNATSKSTGELRDKFNQMISQSQSQSQNEKPVMGNASSNKSELKNQPESYSKYGSTGVLNTKLVNNKDGSMGQHHSTYNNYINKIKQKKKNLKKNLKKKYSLWTKKI